MNRVVLIAVSLLSLGAPALAGVRVLDIDAQYSGFTSLARWTPSATPRVDVQDESALGVQGSRRSGAAGLEMETAFLKSSGFGRDSDDANTATIRHTNSVESNNRSQSSLLFGQVRTETRLTLVINEPVILNVDASWFGSQVGGDGETRQAASLSFGVSTPSGPMTDSVNFLGTGTDGASWEFEVGMFDPPRPVFLTFLLSVEAFVRPGEGVDSLASLAELELSLRARPIPAPGVGAVLIPGALFTARRRR